MRKNSDCINCSELKSCQESYTSWVFFIIGLIAAFALRVVNIVVHIDPIFGKIAWYIGVCGFFMFFIYKFIVDQGRAKLIQQSQLTDKINTKKQLDQGDYKIISNILCSLSSNKDRINYFFIFVLSAIALAIAVYFDFVA